MNKPTRYPAARSVAASIAATLPLPFVPVMWTMRRRFCGSPRFESNARIRSSLRSVGVAERTSKFIRPYQNAIASS